MRLLSLLLAAVLLSGCGLVRVARGPSIGQMLTDAQRDAGTPLTVTGPITLPDGSQLALYTYRNGTACGEGHVYVETGGGSGGRGEGPCRPLSLGTGTLGKQGGILSGRLDLPGVAKVIVTLPNGEEQTAAIGNGMWYVISRADSPTSVAGLRVRALNADGKVLAEAP
jgi:hypothetical protein